MNATERTERLLGTIRKNNREEIRVTRGEFKRRNVVSVRVWFQDSESGEMWPGRDAAILEVGTFSTFTGCLRLL